MRAAILAHIGRREMTSLLRLFVFVLLSSMAVVASFHAWRVRQVYGLFRFLAFEVLAVLIVWNLGRWFRAPFSIHQMASWIVFAASIALAAHGIYLLKAVGKAQDRIMENTQTVVEVGAYRYIRHPIYASLVFFAWGVFLKGADIISGILAATATIFLAMTSRYEERFNIDHFGPAYYEYMKRTKMFIPFLF